MSRYDLFAAWFQVADWCAVDLAKDGYEAVVLQPLGQFPNAAAIIVRAAAQSADYRHRKTAASLAGWMSEPAPSLLDELLRSEAARDAKLDAEDAQRLDSQSVVEDIVFAAARWARRKRSRDAALAVLADIVNRTIAGEYWNTASYAMTTLVRHDADGHADLLALFQAFARGEPPSHPARPNLTQERQFAENLVAGNPGTLGAIEAVLDSQEGALASELDDHSRSALTHLCDVARRFEESCRFTQPGTD